MKNFVLHPSFTELLKDLEPILSRFGIEYYLVGAVARDIQLGAEAESSRKTNDIDIAILVNKEDRFYELRDALIRTGKFEAHGTEAIKLFYQKAIEVDLLPFGEIESPDREIRLNQPRLFILNMPGFMEALPSVSRIPLSDGFTLNVCSIEGLIMLKLISNDDRPERTKDIDDIEHIIRVYFELNDEEIYANHWDLMDLYDTNDKDYLPLISARVIGRKILKLLHSSPLRHRVASILEKRPTILWKAMLDGLRET